MTTLTEIMDIIARQVAELKAAIADIKMSDSPTISTTELKEEIEELREEIEMLRSELCNRK